MSNALALIKTRTKQLQKQHPNTRRQDLVKRASKQLRAEGKIGAANKNRQTGSSNKKRDESRKAKKPGKRTSAAGNHYVERRKNRSDAPGMLTGASASQLKSELKQRVKERLDRYALQLFHHTGTKREKKAIREKIAETKKELAQFS